MKGKTCCVTGHRDLPQNEINKIKTALAHEIDAAVTDGFTCFMSGFADGVDQYFVELVLERKQTTPALELIAVIPYRKRLDSLNKKTRTRELLEACADVVVIQEKYLPSVYSHRNRYMQNQRKKLFIVLPQGMIIRTTLSKWVMCSDLSLLLRILYKSPPAMNSAPFVRQVW